MNQNNLPLAIVIVLIASLLSGIVQGIVDSILHVKITGSRFAVGLSLAIRGILTLFILASLWAALMK